MKKEKVKIRITSNWNDRETIIREALGEKKPDDILIEMSEEEVKELYEVVDLCKESLNNLKKLVKWYSNN